MLNCVLCCGWLILSNPTYLRSNPHKCANRGLSGKPYANPLKPLIPEGWSAASKPLRQVVFKKISGKICFLKIRKVLINNIIY